MVGRDGFANGWQAFPLGPQFGTQVTVKVKASGNGDTLSSGMNYWQLLSSQADRQFLSFEDLIVRNWFHLRCSDI